jgi:hypothetical protein
MTDEELIKLAAKAAKIEDLRIWDPLTDDGDAFDLMVRLGIRLVCSPRMNRAKAEACLLCEYTVFRAVEDFDDDEDPCVAARRAVTRVAAHIGSRA